MSKNNNMGERETNDGMCLDKEEMYDKNFLPFVYYYLNIFFLLYLFMFVFLIDRFL